MELPEYSDVKSFTQPSGAWWTFNLTRPTNLLATPSCLETYSAAFIAGTEPNQTCDLRTGVKGFLFQFSAWGTDTSTSAPAASNYVPKPPGASGEQADIYSRLAPGTGQDPKKKKRDFWQDCGYL